MGKFLTQMMGLLLGATTGALLAILLTRKSGPELRQEIQEWVEGVLDEGRQAAEARRLELTAQLEARTQPMARK